MSRNPILARLHLAIAPNEAVGHGRSDVDVEAVLAVLTPAIEEIEGTARKLVAEAEAAILTRLGRHMRPRDRGGQIFRVTAVECPDEDTMQRMESAAIREHGPEWNVRGIGDIEVVA